ncbi:MAG: restriction endonuclease [Candidatus Deferrimicrobium sp.]
MQTGMTSAEYEKVVAEIATAVARGAGGLPENATSYGRKNLWRGASGFRHQIDVSIEVEERIHLVECKYWNKPVPIEYVLSFYGRIQDIQPTTKKPVEGAIVSQKGFQRGAKEVAAHFRIHLDVVESAEVFGYKFGQRIVVIPKPATCVTSAGGDVNVKIGGSHGSR